MTPFSISIITPTLNSANTIKDTLDSVIRAASILSRRALSVEHLIIDGGSDDNTEAIVKAHKSRASSYLKESVYRCHFLLAEQGGAYAAMNEALEICKGQYAHILNSDDLILDPDLYAKQIKNLTDSDGLMLLSSIVYFRRPSHKKKAAWPISGLPPGSPEWKAALLSGLHYPHPGFIARADIYRQEKFDLRYKHSADYKLMQSLLLRNENGCRIRLCSEPFIAMALGGLSGTWLGIIKGTGEIRAINRELGISGSLIRRYAGKIAMRLVG